VKCHDNSLVVVHDREPPVDEEAAGNAVHGERVGSAPVRRTRLSSDMLPPQGPRDTSADEVPEARRASSRRYSSQEGDLFELIHLLTRDQRRSRMLGQVRWRGVWLSAFGVEPRIDGAVDNFQSLPILVSGSDRVAAVPRRLAERLADAVGVRSLPLPIDAGPIVETLWWHPAHTRDPAHVWLRRVVGDACAHLPRMTTTSRRGPPMSGRRSGRPARHHIPARRGEIGR
jgi:DNA-binding transcriptional LysR family regulator